jgi:hypothetical protein
MKTSFSPGPTSTSSNQDPSTPPAALTVVLSVACGAVATCILVTVRNPKKKKETLPLTHKSVLETLNCTLDHSFAPASSLLQTGLSPRIACRWFSSCSHDWRWRQGSPIPWPWRDACRLLRWLHSRPQHARCRRSIPSHTAQQLSYPCPRTRTRSVSHISQACPSWLVSLGHVSALKHRLISLPFVLRRASIMPLFPPSACMHPCSAPKQAKS